MKTLMYKKIYINIYKDIHEAVYRVIYKIKGIAEEKKGETLIESTAALLIFSILLISVTMMINTSLRITGRSVEDTAKKQDLANKAVFEEYEDYKECTLSLSFDNGKIVKLDINLSLLKLPDRHDVIFTAFSPKVVSP